MDHSSITSTTDDNSQEFSVHQRLDEILTDLLADYNIDNFQEVIANAQNRFGDLSAEENENFDSDVAEYFMHLLNNGNEDNYDNLAILFYLMYHHNDNNSLYTNILHSFIENYFFDNTDQSSLSEQQNLIPIQEHLNNFRNFLTHLEEHPNGSSELVDSLSSYVGAVFLDYFAEDLRQIDREDALFAEENLPVLEFMNIQNIHPYFRTFMELTIGNDPRDIITSQAANDLLDIIPRIETLLNIEGTITRYPNLNNFLAEIRNMTQEGNISHIINVNELTAENEDLGELEHDDMGTILPLTNQSYSAVSDNQTVANFAAENQNIGEQLQAPPSPNPSITGSEVSQRTGQQRDR